MSRKLTEQERKLEPLAEVAEQGCDDYWEDWGRWPDEDHQPPCYICFLWCATCVRSWHDASLPQHVCDGEFDMAIYGMPGRVNTCERGWWLPWAQV